MTQVKTLPVVDLGRDTHGLPTRLSVPVKRDRPIPVMSSGKRIGEVAPDGSMKWRGHNAAPTLAECFKLSEALDQAAKASSQIRVAIIDGKPTSIHVVPERKRRDKKN